MKSIVWKSLNLISSYVATSVAFLLGLVMLGLYLFCFHPPGPEDKAFTHFWEKFFEHLSVAFWVSAIVIFAYETGAKEKELYESLNTLNKLVTGKAKDNMNICYDLIFKDDEGKQPEHLQKACQHLKTLSGYILNLQDQNLWAKDKYIDFINYLLEKVVLKNAKNLVQISGTGNEIFQVLSPDKIADKILTLQMSAMEKGNIYDVVSDIGSWQNNQLSDFQEETKNRVGDGVKVRRIFNIISLDRVLDRMVTHDEDAFKIKEIRKILENHLTDSEEWGMHDELPKYEIKVVGSTEVEESQKRKYLEGKDVNKTHFGLFKHGDGIVQFTVNEPDLSDMKLSTDLDTIEKDLSVFNAIWEHASAPLDKARIDQIVQGLEAVAEKRRHPQGEDTQKG